ncbi:PREDICTED: uncharacterized protein LOC109469614 [Branchiostoma belcheri]|uniref:Uncharacterized protein LOC109469614 n=1 Tax=Branchiostoma belcheri TaxID=7741 RepID=A0A6P4Z2B9_BRABE|nr:PREDICTED: uncharacterized protein LOC109469614 [Branchiostoma belcheri]
MNFQEQRHLMTITALPKVSSENDLQRKKTKIHLWLNQVPVRRKVLMVKIHRKLQQRLPSPRASVPIQEARQRTALTALLQNQVPARRKAPRAKIHRKLQQRPHNPRATVNSQEAMHQAALPQPHLRVPVNSQKAMHQMAPTAPPKALSPRRKAQGALTVQPLQRMI